MPEYSNLNEALEALYALQEKLSAFAKMTSAEYVLYDGVHPAPAGHALICEALYEELSKIL